MKYLDQKSVGNLSCSSLEFRTSVQLQVQTILTNISRMEHTQTTLLSMNYFSALEEWLLSGSATLKTLMDKLPKTVVLLLVVEE